MTRKRQKGHFNETESVPCRFAACRLTGRLTRHQTFSTCFRNVLNILQPSEPSEMFANMFLLASDLLRFFLGGSRFSLCFLFVKGPVWKLRWRETLVSQGTSKRVESRNKLVCLAEPGK